MLVAIERAIYRIVSWTTAIAKTTLANWLFIISRSRKILDITGIDVTVTEQAKMIWNASLLFVTPMSSEQSYKNGTDHPTKKGITVELIRIALMSRLFSLLNDVSTSNPEMNISKTRPTQYKIEIKWLRNRFS